MEAMKHEIPFFTYKHIEVKNYAHALVIKKISIE